MDHDNNSNRSKQPPPSRTRSSSISSPMHDASDPMNSELPISDQLESNIKIWQELINDYKHMEESFIKQTNSESYQYLGAIRSNPDIVIKNANNEYSKNVLDLAHKRKVIFELMEKIGISYDDLRTDTTSNAFLMQQSGSSKNSIPPDPLFTNIRASQIFGGDGDETDSNATFNDTGSASGDSEAVPPGDTFYSVLSSRWASRLGQMIQTQGQLTIQHVKRRTLDDNVENENDDQSWKMKPKWPDYLSDISFAVIKKNRAAHKFPRIIKLTEYHIFNIKDGNRISKTYFYTQIRNIWLEEGDTIVITLRNNKKLVFISDMASYIAQQIITRIKVRHQLDRTDFASSLQSAPGYTISVTSKVIEEISKENTTGAASAMMVFAKELGEKTVKNVMDIHRKEKEMLAQRSGSPLVRSSNLNSIEELSSDEASSAVASAIHSASSSRFRSSQSDSTKKPPASRLPLDNEDEMPMPPNEDENEGPDVSVLTNESSKSKRNSLHIFGIKEGMHEFSIQSELQKIVFDGHTPEGNTRNHFIDKFRKSLLTESERSSCMLDVRHFIDGMHEYILSSRGIQLASIFGARSQSNFISPESSMMSDTVRLTVSDLGLVDEDILTTLSFIIFTVVEEATYLPLKDEIRTLMPSFENSAEEDELHSRLNMFYERTQAEWGIKDDVQSPLNWQSAIFELSNLESNPTPSMMLNTLARTAKAIYSEYKLAVLPLQKKDAGSSSSYLGADDFVPVFIYVFCHSQIERPALNRDIMWNLCHPDQLQGESGYYLTVYESSIEFIMHEELPEVLPSSNQVSFTGNTSFTRNVRHNSSDEFPNYKERLHGVAPGRISVLGTKITMRESF